MFGLQLLPKHACIMGGLFIVLIPLQAWAYLGRNNTADEALAEAKRCSPSDAAVNKLQQLLEERLQLSS